MDYLDGFCNIPHVRIFCLQLSLHMSEAVNVPTEIAYLCLAAGEHALPVAVYAISYRIGMGYKPCLACQHDL